MQESLLGSRRSSVRARQTQGSLTDTPRTWPAAALEADTLGEDTTLSKVITILSRERQSKIMATMVATDIGIHRNHMSSDRRLIDEKQYGMG